MLMKDAIMPNPLQTLEEQPAFVHAVRQHRTRQLIDHRHQIGSKVADFLITESGFGADTGMEKFFDIKCRTSGHMIPSAVVLSATVRALKMHGGGPRVVPGRTSWTGPTRKRTLICFGQEWRTSRRTLPSPGDSVCPWSSRSTCIPDGPAGRVILIRDAARAADAFDAVARHWADGGEGAVELAAAVARATEEPSRNFLKRLYDVTLPIKDKIEILAREVYGADGVDYSPEAQAKVDLYTALGYDKPPMHGQDPSIAQPRSQP